jgi:uncharacterized repeat protein (TIGR01451 family)
VWNLAAGTACAFALLCALAGAATAQTPPKPLFDLKVGWAPSSLPPAGQGQFTVQVRNIGAAPAAEEGLSIIDELPAGVTVEQISWSNINEDFSSFCSGVGTPRAECSIPSSFGFLAPTLAPNPGGSPTDLSPQPSGYLPTMLIDVSIDPQAAGMATNTATVSGGGASAASRADSVPLGAAQPGFGIWRGSYEADFFQAAYPGKATARQAGDHPFEERLDFQLNTNTRIKPASGVLETLSQGLLRTVEASLPMGLSGNPQALPRCSGSDFAEPGSVSNSTRCPSNTQVGYLNLVARPVETPSGIFSGLLSRIPLYNLVPPRGVIADFGFSSIGMIGHMYLSADPARNYAINATIPFISNSFLNVIGAEVTIWGVPGDPAHDAFRYFPKVTDEAALGAPFIGAVHPLLTNPLDCGIDNGATSIRVDSYEDPETFTAAEEYSDPLNVQGCEDPRVGFEPTVSLRPLSTDPGRPTGLEVTVNNPQRDGEVAAPAELYAQSGAKEAIGSPPLRSVTLRLPAGLAVSLGTAQGLGSCSEAQIGLLSDSPPRFNAAQVSCPESSKIGSLALRTPIEPDPLQGSIYLAAQGENPFDDLIALYLVIEDPRSGILLKLPARVALDPRTAQITISLEDLPQQPFSELSLKFKDGPRAPLRMPSACGSFSSHYEITSWADHRPLQGSSSFSVDHGCATKPFEAELSAGSVSESAGSPSSFLVELRQQSGEENLSRASLQLPRGLAAALGSVPLCPENDARSGTCPASSEVGSVAIALGPGPAPLWVPESGRSPGYVSLAGPYRGAPYSLLIAIPAQAGPFDLGTILTRAALYINPRSAQGRVVADPLPQILAGVPLDYRVIRIVLDRPNFLFNPTDCDPASINANLTATDGEQFAPSAAFRVTDCAALPFRPSLGLRLSGALGRNGHPGLRAVLRSHPGEAAIAAAAFTLPPGELLDLHHLGALCPRDEAPAGCPAASRFGQARFYSPLVAEPLDGPIYLREPTDGLPDLIAEVRGARLHLFLHGDTAAPHGRLQIRLSKLPDIPLSKTVITLTGGSRGTIANSQSLCPRAHHAQVTLSAHSGKRRLLRPHLRVRC